MQVRAHPRAKPCVLLLAMLLGGCANVYLHDAGLDAKTAQLKSDYAALKAPAYLDAQHAQAVDFNTREDTAVAALATSARDSALVDFVRPSALATAADSGVLLLHRTDADLGKLYRPAPWSPKELDALENASALAERRNEELVEAGAEVAAAQARFAADARDKKDQRKSDCDSVGSPPDAIPGGGSPADYDYIALQIACRHQADVSKDADPVATLASNSAGDLGQAVDRYKNALADRIHEQALGSAIRDKIKALQQPPAAGQDQSFDTLLTNAETIAKTLQSAPPVARALGLQTLADSLEPALAQALNPNTALPSGTSSDTKAIAASLALLKASAQAGQDFASAPDTSKGDALLIAVAELKHEQNVTNLEVAWDDRRIRLLQAEVIALTLQAEQLVRAHRLLVSARSLPRGFADLQDVGSNQNGERDRSRLAEALVAYTASWDAGTTPYWVLRFKEPQFARMAALEEAQQTDTDTRAVISPAIDQIALGGAGGIKPEVWANLLGDLGIAGAILGK